MSGSSGPGGHVAAYIPANGASSGQGSAYAAGMDCSSNQRQPLTGPHGALHSNTTSSNPTAGDYSFNGSGPGLSGHNPSGCHIPPGGMQQYAPTTLTPTMSIQASNSTAAKMLQSARTPGGLSSDPMRPMLADVPCSCPMICMMQTGAGSARVVPLPTTQLSFRVHCHLGLSFVNIDMLCTFPENVQECKLALFMPKTTDTVVTEIAVENLVRPLVMAAAVVPRDEAQRAGWVQGEDVRAPALDPELFYLPLPYGYPGDQYRVTLSYSVPMLFEAGQYVARLPTMLQPHCLPSPGVSINSVLKVELTINTGMAIVPEPMCTFPTRILMQQQGVIHLVTDDSTPWENRDFVVGYPVWRDSLTATIHVAPPLLPSDPDVKASGTTDLRGSFCISITPPGPEECTVFARSMVFLLDRSGSMAGEPLNAAKRALEMGLSLLQPQDCFAVVAFDHEQIWWKPNVLMPATPDNIREATEWMWQHVTAFGTTDLMTPLTGALSLLGGAPPSVPLVFLITDGCVDNERDICEVVRKQHAAGVVGNVPRIFTFGIGPWCNHYFLKQLALQGRGMADVAFRPHGIQIQMQRMLLAAALPLLTNLELQVEGVELELYPLPLPDVYCGHPLLVAGKYIGTWPETATISGTLATGEVWTEQRPALPPGPLPLHKLFTKSMIDVLTAKAWLADDPPDLKQKVIDLSVTSGIPSAYTCTVCFETTSKKYAEMKDTPKSERSKKITKWAIKGAAGVGLVVGVGAVLGFGVLLAEIPMMDLAGGGDALQGMGMYGEMGCCDCCGGDHPGCEGCLHCATS